MTGQSIAASEFPAAAVTFVGTLTGVEFGVTFEVVESAETRLTGLADIGLFLGVSEEMGFEVVMASEGLVAVVAGVAAARSAGGGGGKGGCGSKAAGSSGSAGEMLGEGDGISTDRLEEVMIWVRGGRGGGVEESWVSGVLLTCSRGRIFE